MPQGSIANVRYYWELPYGWSTIKRVDSNITVKIPENESVAQGKIGLTVDDQSSGRQYKEVKTVNIVQPPKIKAYSNIDAQQGFTKIVKLTISIKEWRIKSYSVKLISDGILINNFNKATGSRNQPNLQAKIEGNRRLTSSNYYIGGTGDDLYHDTKTYGGTFSWDDSEFKYQFSFQLQNANYPDVVINKEFSYSERK